MDRQSKKEVKKYVLCFFVLVATFILSVLALAYYDEQVKSKQLALLVAEHPELEGTVIRILEKEDAKTTVSFAQRQEILEAFEKKYGYHIQAGMWRKEIFFVLILGVSVLAVTFYVLWLVTAKQRLHGEISKKHLTELLELSEQFRCGEYSIPESLFVETDLSDTDGEIWVRLRESFKELGAYFADLKEHYKQEDADTKALITNISHQLKTPLAAIRMSHELAAGDCVSGEERQEFMEQEEIQIAKLQDLLDELVKLSRLEKNMIVLQPKAVGFKQTIIDAVSQIYPKAHAKEMEIVVEITEDAVITHDVKWTTEALINVLDNAVKYSDTRKHIFIRMSRLTRYILIEIEDEGMGIPGAELHKIYHRFYRGSNVEKDSEGAGVGLYLTRWIIEAQGGTIAAKKKMEAGMVFRIMLPLNSGFS